MDSNACKRAKTESKIKAAEEKRAVHQKEDCGFGRSIRSGKQDRGKGSKLTMNSEKSHHLSRGHNPAKKNLLEQVCLALLARFALVHS